MRSIMTDRNGLVYAYVALDGILVLIRDDQPGVRLFTLEISNEDFEHLLARLYSSNPNEEIVFLSWVATI